MYLKKIKKPIEKIGYPVSGFKISVRYNPIGIIIFCQWEVVEFLIAIM